MLTLVCRTDDEALEEHGWQWALLAMDRCLIALGLDEKARLALFENARTDFTHGFRVEQRQETALSHLSRTHRTELSQALDSWDSPRGRPPSLARAMAIWDRRSLQWVLTITALRLAEQRGEFEVPVHHLAASYVHLHRARMFRAGQRAIECAIYDWLAAITLACLEAAEARTVPLSGRLKRSAPATRQRAPSNKAAHP